MDAEGLSPQAPSSEIAVSKHGFVPLMLHPIKLQFSNFIFLLL